MSIVTGYTSSIKQVCKGVPQGSILGPTLFSIYIDDIINASSKVNFTIYADDTTLLLEDVNIIALHESATNELKYVECWIRSIKLKLNVNKTNYVFFQNRSIKHIFPTSLLNNEHLTQVNSTKFLGIKIDENLNWKVHTNYVCVKLSKIT